MRPQDSEPGLQRTCRVDLGDDYFLGVRPTRPGRPRPVRQLPPEPRLAQPHEAHAIQVVLHLPHTTRDDDGMGHRPLRQETCSRRPGHFHDYTGADSATGVIRLFLKSWAEQSELAPQQLPLPERQIVAIGSI